jgi:hypothetical protein
MVIGRVFEFRDPFNGILFAGETIAFCQSCFVFIVPGVKCLQAPAINEFLSHRKGKWLCSKNSSWHWF